MPTKNNIDLSNICDIASTNIYEGSLTVPSATTTISASNLFLSHPSYISYSDFCKILPEIPDRKEEEKDNCFSLTVDRIIHSGPVTVVIWDDGEKTVVRRAEGVPNDPYSAFCAALAKRVYGNNSQIKKILARKTVEQKKKEEK